ncbi:MAG TPA: VanZ family protein [Chitinophagaceae bacterium]|nr:VanZ family protein [Chitinophagaceae bacterium]
MKRTSFAIVSALSWSIGTTILLCLPGTAFPKEKWFDSIWLDKWVHIGLFSTLVFLWCWFATKIKGKENRRFLEIAIYFFLYGIAMEFVQKYFIPNRSFDVGDILADGIGCVSGLLISLRVYKKNRPL